MTPAEAKKAEAYFHFSMARVLDQEQAFDDSIKEYRKALEVTPNDAEIYSAMARTYLNQRNREEASKAAQKSVESPPPISSTSNALKSRPLRYSISP